MITVDDDEGFLVHIISFRRDHTSTSRPVGGYGVVELSWEDEETGRPTTAVTAASATVDKVGPCSQHYGICLGA